MIMPNNLGRQYMLHAEEYKKKHVKFLILAGIFLVKNSKVLSRSLLLFMRKRLEMEI